MALNPDIIPACPGCPRGCEDSCRTAGHIEAINLFKASNDTANADVRERLNTCAHLTDPTSVQHAAVKELIESINNQPELSQEDFFRSIGANDQQAADLAGQNDESLNPNSE